MADPRSIAELHRTKRRDIVRGASSRLERSWGQVDPTNIYGSFVSLLPSMVATVAQAQTEAVSDSDRYIRELDKYNGFQSDARPVPEAFVGVGLSGVNLESLLAGAAFSALSLIKTGVPVREAMTGGRAYLVGQGGSTIYDAGRTSDRVNLLSRPTYTTYVRMIGPGACSRCIQLAGMWSWKIAFKRHPRCACIAVPSQESVPGGMETDPREYFDRLSRDEQDRRFTNAGAEAIRNGADINRVVNSRRGADKMASPSGTGPRRIVPTNIGTKDRPIWVYKTDELNKTRAREKRRFRDGIRLMPEQIVKMAGDDRQRLIELLRRYGYII